MHTPLFTTKLVLKKREDKLINSLTTKTASLQMSRHGTTNFTDCTAVRHKSLNKSVSTHGHGLSDVAYSKHFYTFRSNFGTVTV